MTTNDTLVVAWLLLAHLVGDFVLQNEGMVRDKNNSGARRWRGLVGHGAGVGLALSPVALVYGERGVAFLIAIVLGHVVIDRWKVRATRHAEAVALAAAHRRHEPSGPETGLGPAWTPLPGALFVADQAFHVILIVVAWMALLAGTAATDAYLMLADRFLGGTDRAAVHAATLGAVVVVSLLLVNVRAGALFVATLVNPRASVTGDPPAAEAAAVRPAAPGWRLRLGPFTGSVDPVAAAVAPTPTAPGAPHSPPARQPDGHAPPARIGATIGVLERLLIVAFVLTGSTAAIGFVVAAKTLARFKQLDDRDFAEYYLLGTLASVSVALGSGLVAAAALASLA